MAQVIKYQTTTVTVDRTAGEIAELVRRYGGTRLEYRWGERGNLEGIRFAIRAEPWGEVPVMLTARTARIFDILWNARGPRSRRAKDTEVVEAQAERIAWRQLKDFVEQSLLAVETGLFDLASAFMAHMEAEDPETGERMPFSELVGRTARLVPHRDGDLLRIGP